MSILKKYAVSVWLVLFAMIFVISGCSSLNNYQTKGDVSLLPLKSKVRVLRDEKGMAYIYADNIYDAITAQGYVTAQDRLFQMHLLRVLARGELAKYFGEKALEMDVFHRTIGFYRAAEKHIALLDDKNLKIFQAYANGVNEYIRNGSDTHHMELGLAGFEPDPWQPVDTAAIVYFMGWGSAANISTEIMTQMLLDKIGMKKTMSIFPVNINPDDALTASIKNTAEEKKYSAAAKLNFIQDLKTVNLGFGSHDSLRLGSNNWAVGTAKSPGGKPIMVNDPHLATKMLPTTLYPIGMITPEFRTVGAIVPGMPGFLAGRNEYVAAGITNSYGDCQDLYVETIDPGNDANYMEGQ